MTTLGIQVVDYVDSLDDNQIEIVIDSIEITKVRHPRLDRGSRLMKYESVTKLKE